MNIKLDERNHVTVEFENGARIVEMVLSGVKVIEGPKNCKQLGSGSYLMFPWVNRIRKYDHQSPHKDKNGYHLHGHCTNLPRNYEMKQSPDEIKIALTLSDPHQLVPPFSEIFILRKGSFQIQFQTTYKDGPCCFGYHPYFQIDDYKLQEIKLSTDVKEQLELDQNLLVVYPFKVKETQISTKNKYDSLFRGGSFFHLEAPDGKSIHLTSSLKFWQVYTPDDHRIAIQPMSYCGNLYQIYELQNQSKKGQGQAEKLPQKGQILIKVSNGKE